MYLMYFLNKPLSRVPKYGLMAKIYCASLPKNPPRSLNPFFTPLPPLLSLPPLSPPALSFRSPSMPLTWPPPHTSSSPSPPRSTLTSW